MKSLHPNAIDITGQKYGRLTVIGFAGRQGVNLLWDCACECGNTCKAISRCLRSGGTASCGCLAKEIHSARMKTHGLSTPGSRQHPLYRTWVRMRERCNSPNGDHWKNYGGRGIKVCERWNDFTVFVQDMFSSYSPGMTIERKDVNGNYEPNNCRWATTQEQCWNKRITRMLTFNGVTKPRAQWAKELGIPCDVISGRMRIGWSADRCLTTPVQLTK